MSDKEQTKEQKIPQFGYKIAPEAIEVLKEYFNTRPSAEVDPFFNNILDVDVEDPLYSEPAIQVLIQYLNEKCPRGEAKPIIDMLKKDNVLTKWEIKPQAGEKKEG